jgi:titin
VSSTITSATLTYADTGLTNGTVYYYRIAAVSAAGTGSYAVTSARPFTTAAAPATITATPQDASALITWTAPASTGGLAITNYILDVCTTSAVACIASATTGFTVVSSAVPATSLSYAVSGLTNGTQYWFRVRAVTSAGNGTGVVATATPGGAPSAVVALIATAANTGNVALTWTAPAANGSAITGYKVEMCTTNCATNGTFTVLGTTTATTPFVAGALANFTCTSITACSANAGLAGLINGTNTTFRVSAINAIGTGYGSLAVAIPFTFAAAPTGSAGTITANPTNADNYGGAVTTDGPTLWYRFNNASGSTAVTDASGTTRTSVVGSLVTFNGNAGSPFGGTSGSATFAGTAGSATAYPTVAPTTPINLAGGISTLSGNDLKISGSVTLEAWVKPAAGAPNRWQTIVARGNSGTNARNYGLYTNNYQVGFAFNTAGGNQYVQTQPNVIEPNVWSHLVGVFDQTTGLVKIYVNGQLQASAFGTQSGTLVNSALGEVMIGNNYNTDASFFNGQMSEVAIYNKAVTGARILAHYNASGISAQGKTAPSVTSNGSSLTLNWTAPANTGGLAITGYKIDYVLPSTTIAANTGAAWTTLIADTGSTSTSYTLNSAVTSALGQGYSFQVSAITSAGVGAASLPVGPIGTAAAPSEPRSLTAVGGTAQVALTWSAPATTGGLNVTSYTIERSADNGVTWVAVGTATGTSPFVTGAVSGFTCTAITACTDGTSAMLPGASFQYRVAAITPAGASSFSIASAGPANTVTALLAVVGNAQVSLSWDIMPTTAGQTVAGYFVEYCTGTCTTTAGTYTAVTAITGAPTNGTTPNNYITVTGLTNGTIYTFRVRAVYGASNTRGPAVIVTGMPVASAQISVQLLNSTPSTTNVALNWLAPVQVTGNTVSGYLVEYCASNCGVAGAVFTSATPVAGSPSGVTTTLLSYTISGLVTDNTYAFRVTPVLASGSTGVASPSVVFDTPAATVDAPTAMVAAGRLNSVLVSWTPPATRGGYPILGYRVEYRVNNTGNWTTATTNSYSSTPNYVVTGLTAGVTYGFQVTALTAAGPGATSASVTGVPFGAAAAPTNLRASASSGQAVLQWETPISNGGNAITGYRIESSVDGGTTWSDEVANTNSTATSYTITGLDNGVTILIRVSAITSAGSGQVSNVAPAIPSAPASAPINVSAIVGNAQAVLTWTAPADTGGLPVSGYMIERSVDGTTWTTVTANTGNPVPASVQSGLINGVTYQFRISAITAGGTGVASTPFSVKPYTSPSAPTAFVAQPSDGQITMTWGVPTSDGGAAVTDYRVEQSLDGGITWTAAAASTGGTRQATITGLTNGTPILLRVFAINIAGVGTPTQSISTSAYTVPGAPTALRATGANASVLLSWTAPLNTNGSPVSGYKVERSSDAGATWITAIANTANSGTNVVVNGLTNGTAYTFRVSAINAAGAGDASGSTGATPLTTASAPTALTVTSGNTTATLAWALPTNNGGASISGYNIDRSSDGGVTWTSVATNVATLTFSDSSLTNGTTYLYRVSAVNAAGIGSSSAGVAVVPAAKAGAPTGLTATSGSGSVILSWVSPANTGGAAITGYFIEISEDGGSTWRTAIANTNTSAAFASVGDLADGQLYTFRVSAINAAGTGIVSGTASGTPVIVSSVVLSGTPGSTTASLTWTAPTDIVQTGYVVEKSTDGITWTSAMANPTANATSGSATGLINGTMYFFRIQVVTAGGPASSYSNYVALVPRGTAAAPTSLAAAAGDTQVTLRWVAPSSDGGTAITGYKVEYSANAGTTWTVAAATTGNQAVLYTVTGLTNATAYTFRVSAVNTVGTGITSTTTVATPYTIPGVPTTVTTTAGTAQVVVNWTAPTSNGGSAITAYVVQVTSDGGATWTTLTSSTTALTYTATGLTNGTTYAFRVAAVNAAGTGIAANPVTGTPFEAPNAPTALSTVAGDTSVSISWTAPTNVPSTSIIGYKVEKSANAGTTWTVATANTASNLANYTATGLTNGTLYAFRVTALISAGPGIASASTSATPFGIPSAPQGVTAVSSDSQVAVSWTAPLSNGGSALTGYVVQISTDGGATFVDAATTTGTSSVIGSLTNGTSYVFRVVAKNAAGNGIVSATASGTPFTSPAAPTSPQAIGGTNEVVLSWTAPTSTGGGILIGYRIERSSNGGTSWTTVVSNTGSTATAFTVGNLSAGALYTFRIAAVTNGGFGAYSVNVTGAAVGLATAPGSLTANAGTGQVTLAWTAPTSTGGSTVSTYAVEKSADGGVTWSTVTTAATGTSYVVTGLTNATTYSFRVSAVNASGAGISSAPATATPFTTPGAPTGLSVVSATSQAVLVWTMPTSDGGTSITGYKVEQSTDNGATWSTLAANTGSASTVYVVSGLTNGNAYRFRVSAVNTAGTGAVSSDAAVTPSGTATAPRSLTATAADGQVALSWVAPASTGGNAVMGYFIEVSSNGGTTWSTLVGNTATTATTYTATGLANGTTYAFRVFAINSNGIGAVSSPASAAPFTTPGQVPAITAIAGNAQVLLSWTAPTTDGGGAIAGYKIERSADSGATWSIVTANTNSAATNYTASGLTNGTVYSFRVSAVNGAGTGTASSNATATPFAGAAAPTALSATPSSTQVVLSWTAPSATGGSAIAGYRVESTVNGGASWSTLIADTASTSTSYTATGLTNGQQYGFRVSAINGAGVGVASSVATSTPFTTAAAPTSVSATPADTQVLLTWVAGASNGASVTGYVIEQSNDAGATWSTVSANTSSALTRYTVTALTNGTSYTFRVAAINQAGTGSATASSATVPAGAPSAPTALVVAPGNTAATLTWTAPTTDGGSAITGYRIERSVNSGATWTTVVANTASASTSYTTTGLTNGTAYNFRVSALNAVTVGASSLAGSVVPAGVPVAPTSLIAAPTNGAVVLVWTRPLNDGGNAISGYMVETSIDGGANWTIAIANTNSTVASTTVSGLTNGSPYSFRISAVNAVGSGATSSVVLATPASVPTVPQNFAATASNGQVALLWSAPASNGGSSVTGYRIERSTDGITWNTISSGVAGTTFAVTGLTNGTSYMFRVAATNSIGDSAMSASVVSIPAAPATAPQTFVATAGDRAATLSWSAPASNGGLPVLSYTVQRSIDGGSTWSAETTGVIGYGYSVTGLTNLSAYMFRVAAVTAAGQGAWATMSSPVTPFRPPVSPTTPTEPDAPTGVTTTVESGQTTLTWTTPASDGGAAISGYIVERSTNGGATWTTVTSTMATTFVVTGLTNGVTYVFRITAANSVGNGLPSAMAVVTPATVASAPTNISISTGNGLLSFSWLAPASTGGMPVVSYVVETSATGTTGWTTASTGSPSTSLVIDGLTNGVPLYMRVAAVTAIGQGAWASANGTPSIGAVPGISTNLVATPGAGQVALHWVAPVAKGGSPITGYLVEKSLDGNTWMVVTSNTGSPLTSYNVTGLANGTTTYLRVSAINGAGNGLPTGAVTVTPLTTASAPQSLVATPGNTQVSLVWTAPLDNGGSAVTGYTVQVSSNSGATWSTMANVVGTTYAATGLTNGTSYAFRVLAVNGGGAGSASAPDVAVPFATASAVRNLTVTPADSQVTVTWNAPSSNGGSAVTGYRVAYSTDNGATFSADTVVTGTTAVITGLTNGAAVVVRVIPVNAGGNGTVATSTPATPRAVAGAPTLVVATASNGQVSLSWAAPVDNGGSAITGYYVERAVGNAGAWSRVDTTTSTTSISTGLTNGTTYAFRVIATNAAGAGAATEAVLATPATTPGAPTSVSTVAGDGFVTLAWVAPVSNGGTVVTSYFIEKSIDGATWTSAATTSAREFTVTGLTNGQAYRFRVSAENAAGTGASAQASSTVTPSAKAAAPSAIVATPTDGVVTLSWTAPTDTGGSTLTGYVVEQSTDGGVTWTTAASTATPSTTLTGLVNGTTYSYRVRANNSIGSGAASTVATTTPFTTPGAPRSVTALTSDKEVLLTWGVPTNSGGSAITGYVVQASTNGTTWTTVDTPSVANTTISGLTNGVTYSYRVFAVNAAVANINNIATSGATPSTVVTAMPKATASAPLALTPIAGDRQVTLSWTAPVDNGGVSLTGYAVQRSADGGRTWTSVLTTAPSALTATITGLTNGVAYVFRVSAVNAAGTGAASVWVTSAPVAPPAAPASVAAIAAATGATLNWLAPADDGGAAIVGYRIEQSADGGATWGSAVQLGATVQSQSLRKRAIDGAGLSTATTLQVTGLQIGQSYTFRVQAYSVIGASPWNQTAVTAGLPPATPAAPTVTPSETSAVVSWQPVTAAGTPTYTVQRSSDGGRTWVTVTTTTSTSITDSALTANTSYSYRITAAFAGLSSAASPATATKTLVPAVVTPDPVFEIKLILRADLVPTSRNLVVVGANLKPTSVVKLFVSKAVTAQAVDYGTLLGTTTVKSDGTFVLTTLLPSNLTPGTYELTATGTAYNGAPALATAKFVVPANWPEVLNPSKSEASGSPAVTPTTDAPTTTTSTTVPETTTTSTTLPTPAPVPTKKTPGGKPFNPKSEPKGVVDLAANAAALAALMAAGAAARGRKKDDDTSGDNSNSGDGEDRGSGDVAGTDVNFNSADVDDAEDSIEPRTAKWLDRWSVHSPHRLVGKSPLLARLVIDGTYLRSLLGIFWLALPIAGVVIGLLSAINTDFNIVMPSLALLVAILVVGIFDALSGLLGVLVFAIASGIGGGFNSSDSIRGMLGLCAFSFGVPLIATASRPFFRASDGTTQIWNRSVDFVLVTLFGAWAAGGMFGSLPGLTGHKPDFAGRGDLIQGIALALLVVRFGLEYLARHSTSARFKSIHADELAEPSVMQKVLSICGRSGVFAFVAVVFIGNNWALWVGTALYGVPKFIDLITDNFPNFARLHRFLPRGIFKVVVIMLIARWWGTVVANSVTDPNQMIKVGFVLLGLPGLVAGIAGWFGREGGDWKSTKLSRVMGAVLLIIGFLMVRGVLFTF